MRHRFASGNLETASGPRIVVLCFDRLDRDLATALDGLERATFDVVNDALGHAQDLLGELAGMLDVEAWEHAPALLSIYDYLLRLLATGNAGKDPGMVREAARLVSELGDGFRAAAAGPSAPPVGVGEMPRAAGSPTGPDVARQRLSVRA